MFRKSNSHPQMNIFTNVHSMLRENECKIYDNPKHWHNIFREHLLNAIDEELFGVLFDNSTGAPNYPVRIILGMTLLKEAYNCSDSQLFERCQFDMLARAALGLFNMNDSLPSQSTYYFLRKRIVEHQERSGEDLMGAMFKSVTRKQIKEFEVNGQHIRMDSKLFGSNIALYSRYEIIHQTLVLFCKHLSDADKARIGSSELRLLNELLCEEASKTVYRSNKADIKARMQKLGQLCHKIILLFSHLETQELTLLRRMFSEQYASSGEQIELRPNKEIAATSLQSPHDADCTYRDKGSQTVKGYVSNIVETCADSGLNLIVGISTESASTADADFTAPAIEAAKDVICQTLSRASLDGGYHTPDNDEYCKGIDMIYSGLQGAPSRYDLEMTQEGLLITDTQTGIHQIAQIAKKTKSSKASTWRIRLEKGWRYFNEQAVRASAMRRRLRNRTQKELNKRNNVESTIFHFCCSLRNNKSKYRGIQKQRLWSCCRCLWINIVRIANFVAEPCQRTPEIA